MQTLEQKRAHHALQAVLSIKETDYGNYASYVKRLPVTILMNGLGQAAAMEKARQSEKGHEILYSHLQSWLCHAEDGVFRGRNDLLEAMTQCQEADYVRAQGEALAWLNWLKKFSSAYLQEKERV